MGKKKTEETIVTFTVAECGKGAPKDQSGRVPAAV